MNHSYTVEVEGQKLQINEVEFLYFYENEKKEKFIVFEYYGKKYESKVKDE